MSTRRTVLSMLGLAPAVVVSTDSFASHDEQATVRAVNGAVDDETMANAFEQMARAIRSGAAIVEEIDVHSTIRTNEILGRHTMTVKFIHLPEVKVG